MLKSLTLHNFKKHRDLHVEFDSGVNGIFGPNYRGKTSIFHGILFAMGGSSHVPGTRLQTADAEGRMSVELQLDLDGASYKLVRTKSTANLYRMTEGEWVNVATSATAVTDEMERLIGITIKEWKELHYAKQKSAHALLKYSATALHQLMRRLNGAEQLDTVVLNLKNMATRAASAAETFEQAAGMNESEMAEAKARLASQRGQIGALEEQVEASRENVNTRKARLDEVQSKVVQTAETIYSKGVQAATAEKELSAVREAEAGFSVKSERAIKLSASIVCGDAEVDPHQVIQLRAKVTEVEKAEAAMSLKARDLQTERANLARRRVALEAAQASPALAIQDDETDVAAQQSKADRARNRIAEAQASLRTLRSQLADAVCPTCKRPMEEHNPDELKAEIAKLTAALQEDNAVLEQANLVLKVASDRESAAAKAKAVVEAAESELASVQASVARQEAAISEAGMQIDKLFEELGDLVNIDMEWEELLGWLTDKEAWISELNRRRGELTTLEAELDEEQRRLQAMRAECASKGYTAELVSILTAKMATLRASQEQLGEGLPALEEELQLANEALQAAQAKLTTLIAERRSLAEGLNHAEEVWKQSVDARKRLASIQALQKYLKVNAEGFMAKAWDAFLARASNFVWQCTGGDISEIRRTNDGAFVFVEDGMEMQLEEASGAQEAIIGLAVQLSLAEAAPCGLNLLMLDEPTADMDPLRSMAAISAMGGLGRQVVYVSHHQSDNVVTSNAIVFE